MRPAGMPDEPATVITGQYREGAWSQSARYGEDAAEDLIVARDGPGGPLRSYTRPAGETIWMRWPGEDFDAWLWAGSPFSVLRLYPLADEQASGEADPLARNDRQSHEDASSILGRHRSAVAACGRFRRGC